MNENDKTQRFPVVPPSSLSSQRGPRRKRNPNLIEVCLLTHTVSLSLECLHHEYTYIYEVLPNLSLFLLLYHHPSCM